MRFGKSQWSSFDLGVYKVNAIPEVQVTNTRMDQWGFQGITILWEILGILLLRELLRDLENLNGVPLLQGSLYTMGNNNFFFFDGALARFGKISMEFLHWGVYMGITARFGKISMEFLHLGGFQGNHTVVSKVRVTNTRMDQ